MANLGSLTVWLNANTSKFNRGMSKGMSITTKFVQGIKAGSAIAVAALIGLGAKSLELFAKQDRVNRKLAATLKATGFAAQLTSKQIKDYASELQRATNIGDDEIINSAAVMSTFKNVVGDTFTESIGLANDMSAVLDTSLNSSVIQLGKALNDPVKGITALTRSGVSFTDQQKAQIRALQESGDLLGAQTIIMGELRSEFGGVAAEMAKADIIKSTTNALGDMAEVLGEIIVKALELDTITGGVAGGLNEFTDTLKANLDGIVVFFQSTAVGIEFMFRKTIVGARDVVAIITSAIADSINFVVSLVKTSVRVVDTLFDLIVSSFKELGRAIVNFFKDPTAGFKFDLANLKFDENAFKLNLRDSEVKKAVNNMKANMAALSKEEEKVQAEIQQRMFDRQNADTKKQLEEIKKVKEAKIGAAVESGNEIQKLTKAQFAGALEKGSIGAFSASLNRPIGLGQETLKENKKQTKSLDMVAKSTQKIADNTNIRVVTIPGTA